MFLMQELKDIHFNVSPLWKKTLKIMAVEEDTTITKILQVAITNHPRFLKYLAEVELKEGKKDD